MISFPMESRGPQVLSVRVSHDSRRLSDRDYFVDGLFTEVSRPTYRSQFRRF
jgi:hypothetical protein